MEKPQSEKYKTNKVIGQLLVLTYDVYTFGLLFKSSTITVMVKYRCPNLKKRIHDVF